jgi:membrane-associated phospholipid phosphatase
MLTKNRKMLYSFIIALIMIFVFVYLTREVVENETYQLDLSINTWATSLRNPILTQAMKTASDIGMIGGIFIMGLVLTYFVYLQKIHLFFGLFVASVGAALTTYCIKLMIARDRPELVGRLVTESGFSFPSGHATTAFVAFPILAMIVYLNPEIPHFLKYTSAVVLVLFAFVVAFSRIYLGVHYFTDVVAGAVVGLSATCVFYYFRSNFYL